VGLYGLLHLIHGHFSSGSSPILYQTTRRHIPEDSNIRESFVFTMVGVRFFYEKINGTQDLNHYIASTNMGNDHGYSVSKICKKAYFKPGIIKSAIITFSHKNSVSSKGDSQLSRLQEIRTA
jgi:hypothetical protein